ncbi:MAG: amidase [Gammaproteobacteria bacterium]|nr:amidase [Gammaproteobacteria bacterium]
MTELWQQDAVELAHLIRTGQVSCEEVIAAHLRRIERVNPALNAIVLPLHEEARVAAAQADQALARGDILGPLHGVPVTIKVNTDQAGCPTDNGVEAFRDRVAAQDSPTVSNFRKAGAIPIGRTNTPAFSMRWFTENTLHGVTLNPWDHARTPGGSSGGAASSVAAGMAPIGQGNDIAGSVRYPAFCCALVGLRPSYGRAPTYNPSTGGAGRPISAQLMAVQGPLTRTVRDARLAMEVMAAGDIRDPKWNAVPFDGEPLSRPIRVAVVENPAGRGLADAVEGVVKQAAAWLENAGYIVEDTEPPELGNIADLWTDLAIDDLIKALLPDIEEHGDEGIQRAVGYWCAGAPRRGPQVVLDALVERERLLRAWEVFLDHHPLVLMPSSGEQAFPLGFDSQSYADYQRIWHAQLPQLAIPVLGLPAINVPTGLHEGLPMGVQLVSRRYREDVCLAAAEIIEAHAQIDTPVV